MKVKNLSLGTFSMLCLMSWLGTSCGLSEVGGLSMKKQNDSDNHSFSTKDGSNLEYNEYTTEKLVQVIKWQIHSSEPVNLENVEKLLGYIDSQLATDPSVCAIKQKCFSLCCNNNLKKYYKQFLSVGSISYRKHQKLRDIFQYACSLRDEFSPVVVYSALSLLSQRMIDDDEPHILDEIESEEESDSDN